MEKDQLCDLVNVEDKDDEASKAYIGSGLNCLHGASYQLKLLMLFLLRALHKGYSFYLATEIEAADKFDDVVFQLRENGEKVLIFVQAKHKQEEEKRIEIEDLIKKRGNSEYYLPKYFISYLKIKHHSEFTDSVLREFILCTNLELDLDPNTADNDVKRFGVPSSMSNQMSEIFVVNVESNDDFFRDGGTRYRFYYHNNGMILGLKDSLLKVLEDEKKDLKNNIKILSRKPHLTQKLSQIRQWLRAFEEITSDNIEEQIKSFLDSLVLAVGQPNEIKLTRIMKSELNREFNSFNSSYVYARFQEVMLDWLKDKRGYFLTQDDGSKFFDKLRVEVHGHFLINVLSPVESFFGRDEELKTLHDLINQGESTQICQPTLISGLGGIGKTQLVRKYISEYGKQHYDNNILWIDAESYESMKASFIELARVVLGVVCKDLDIKYVLRETYSFFAKRRCLFIFDNANAFRNKDSNAGISDFLPRGTNTPKVLITSRNSIWGDIPQLKLKTFKEQEAFDFIKRELGIEDESQDADISKLADSLQYFPLALQQTVAYIKVKSRALKYFGSEFKVSDYIKKYKIETKNLLDFQFPKDSRDLYTETTFTTIKISIIRIKENKECGEQANQILNIISLLSPDNIPVEMFLELDLIQNNKEKLGEAIELLKEYSLINSGQVITQLNVHRLVQQVTRIILTRQKREENIFEDVMGLLLPMFKETEHSNNYVLIRHLLNHSESFLYHLDSWIEKHPENEKIVNLYFDNLYPFITRRYFDFGYSTRQKEIQKRALDHLTKKYGNNHISFTSPLVNLGDAYCLLGNPQKGKELIERALKILEKHFGINHIEVANTLTDLSNIYGALGDSKKQKELCNRALKIQEKHYGRNHLTAAKTLVNQGNAYLSLGDTQKAKELFEEALIIQEKHYGRNHSEISKTLTNLGNAYLSLGDTQKAKELYEEALIIQQKHYGRNHIEVANTLTNLGNAYLSLGDTQKAKELYEEALIIQQKHYGRNHIEVANPLTNLGNAYLSLGDTQKAKELYEEALIIQEKHYGRNHIEVAKTLPNLGNAYLSLGDTQKAKELYEEALIILEKHYGRNHIELAKILTNLGRTYGVLGDTQKAKELYEEALIILEKHFGRNHIEVANTLVNLGRAYGNLGDPQKGKELLERALEIQEKHYGYNHEELTMTLYYVGNTYGALGNPQKQKDVLVRALGIQVKHGNYNFFLAMTLACIGVAYGVLGDLNKRKEFLKRALKIKENIYDNM